MANVWLGSFVYSLNLLILTSSEVPELGQDDEFFTAASDMALLLKVEHKLGSGLWRYLERERMKIRELEREIVQIERQLESKTGEGDDDGLWVSQPVNAYGIIKRLTKFWPSFREHATDKKTDLMRDNLITDLKSLDGAYPSENDLRGALSAIVRIQNTYNITASEFVNELGSSMQKLDVKELFQMGYLWSEMGDYFHAKEWLLEAVKRFPPKVKVVGFLEKASLYEYLAWSEYQMFDLKKAIKHTKYVLKLKPGHRAAMTNLKLFRDYQERVRKEGINLNAHIKPEKKINISWEVGKHNMLCRGKVKVAKEISDKLYCKYGIPNSRFILKPLKVEHFYSDPDIVLYHELLLDYEIDHLKERATPYLSRATVHDPKTLKLTYADYRISKSSWIKPEMDSMVSKIYEKVSLITGLDTRSYEPLQIANYGLAGQYEPHFDHATEKMPKRFSMYGGNRLATLLIYLSDVERGGNTIFTKTGASIAPRKGTGAFWYNLKRNGQGCNRTEHAACPVVLGQKWVSNIWIHEHHQEFARPCSLDKDK